VNRQVKRKGQIQPGIAPFGVIFSLKMVQNPFGQKAFSPYFCTPFKKWFPFGKIDPWCNGNTTDFGSVI
jgi:hypothetical protein